MSAQPEGFLFNRSDKVGWTETNATETTPFISTMTFLERYPLTLTNTPSHPSNNPPVIRTFCAFVKLISAGPKKRRDFVIGSRHRDECPHLLLGDGDLLAESLIHHVLQHGNAGGLLKLLDSGCGGAYEYDVVDHRYEALFSGSGGFLVLHRNEVFHAFLVQKPFGLQLTVVGDPHREPHQFLSLAWSAHLLSC